MTSVSSVFNPAVLFGEPADDASVISLAERAGDTPRKVDPEKEELLRKARHDMMMQPFIEMLFYGEEEETGNVTPSTML